VIHENTVVAAVTKEGTAAFSNRRGRFHPARRFRIEVSKRLQFPVLFFRQKRNAHPPRCFAVCVLSSTPKLHRRSKRFCGLGDFPLNNHKKCIGLSPDPDPPHPAPRRCFPFHGATTVLKGSLPALLVHSPIQDLYGGPCFSQNGLYRRRTVLRVVRVTTPFYCYSWG